VATVPALSNVFAELPVDVTEEVVDTLVNSSRVRIERIVSHGHASPPGFWYDQRDREFVILLEGAARLRFEDGEQAVEMRPGDFIDIPAHRKHRVDWTAPGEATIWLAVHHA
jgi:cupin 2 domain-containing protein